MMVFRAKGNVAGNTASMQQMLFVYPVVNLLQ